MQQALFRGFGADSGLLLLRVTCGLLMLTGHGVGKLENLLAGRGRSGPFGMDGIFPQFLVTGAEFFCSILVVLGVFTPLAAVPLVVGLLTAVLWAHAGDPFFPGRTPVLTAAGETIQVASGAKELALLYAGGFATLVFTGAGRFSVDALLAPWFRRQFGAAPRR